MLGAPARPPPRWDPPASPLWLPTAASARQDPGHTQPMHPAPPKVNRLILANVEATGK